MYIDDKSLFLNKMWQGMLIGALVPVLSFFIYYLFRFGQLDFPEYLRFLMLSKKFVGIMSISVLPNLIPFMLMVNSDRYRSGRGVLAVTIIFGVAVFALKLIL